MGSAMDNSPLPTFLGSALPGRDELPIPLRLGQPGPLRVSDPLGLIDVLRQALDGGTRPIDSILRAATDAARVLTGAHGTALALRTDGVILCRARSGDIAPALGAPLNVESGISGECLRSATILVCNDAASDPRVDREACLSLGVRSIVVVPLRGGRGMAGLMEAFSTRAYAFGTEQIDTLRALAEIAEAAYQARARRSSEGRLSGHPVSGHRVWGYRFSNCFSAGGRTGACGTVLRRIFTQAALLDSSSRGDLVAAGFDGGLVELARFCDRDRGQRDTRVVVEGS
jgi:hypothetical protein